MIHCTPIHTIEPQQLGDLSNSCQQRESGWLQQYCQFPETKSRGVAANLGMTEVNPQKEEGAKTSEPYRIRLTSSAHARRPTLINPEAITLEAHSHQPQHSLEACKKD